MGLSEQLKTLRRSKGLTQAQAASLIGVVRTTITNIEKGTQGFDFDRGNELLERLSQVEECAVCKGKGFIR